jgi:hypothetical protein
MEMWVVLVYIASSLGSGIQVKAGAMSVNTGGETKQDFCSARAALLLCVTSVILRDIY